MIFLFFQIWFWLVFAFALGWFSHWFFCCRGAGTDSRLSENEQYQTSQRTTQYDVTEMTAVGSKPETYTSLPSEVDDLKRIKGIGSVIEQTLNEHGVYQFRQIASWTADNISWIEDSLSFPGRVEREQWVEQAKLLATGGRTEFADRVDHGDVDYD